MSDTQDAAASAAAPAQSAQSVLDRASMVLRLPWRHCTTTLLPRFFRLIIGGRSLPPQRKGRPESPTLPFARHTCFFCSVLMTASLLESILFKISSKSIIFQMDI